MRQTRLAVASLRAVRARAAESLREAVDLWEGSDFARQAFGEAVWKHYLNYGRTEQRLFDEVVTDYERRRMFERG